MNERNVTKSCITQASGCTHNVILRFITEYKAQITDDEQRVESIMCTHAFE